MGKNGVDEMSEKYIDEIEVTIDIEKNVGARPRLEELTNLSEGTISKLFQMFYLNGPGNGTFLSLPFDQKYMEHGPLHEFVWERKDATVKEIKIIGKGCADIRTIAELVNTGNFSAYVLPAGVATKFKRLFRPDIPLIYKIDGRITEPKSAAIQSNIGSVEEAQEIGATAIGMSLYPGAGGLDSERDRERIAWNIRDAHDAGFPAVVWAYARGPGLDSNMQWKDEQGTFDGMTQADSLYWVDYAVTLAEALGADLIKTKFPAVVKPGNRRAYNAMLESLAKKNPDAIRYKYLEPRDPNTKLTEDQHVLRAQHVIDGVPGTFVIFSGGPKRKADPTEDLISQTRIIMRAGAEGGIYGRNIWGLPTDRALKAMEVVIGEIKRPEFRRQLTQPRFAGYK